jgi:hypothetical protein
MNPIWHLHAGLSILHFDLAFLEIDSAFCILDFGSASLDFELAFCIMDWHWALRGIELLPFFWGIFPSAISMFTQALRLPGTNGLTRPLPAVAFL